MTEDFRLPVLFKYHTYGEGDAKKSFTGIKMVFVCEEKDEQIEEQLSVMAEDGGSRPAVQADVTHVRWTLPSVAPGESGRLEYPAIIR